MPVQRSFEELGVPLADVTFCVLDLETTGGSPADCGITEVGACKVRRGEVVGTFHTLVNPGRPVPAFIRLLTGISDELLVEAPDIEAVLPSLIEFARDSVIVAHNARFDMGFINCALERADYPRLGNRVLDTAILARKILSDEVPNHKLSTLARHLRCAHQPNHRAYTDVLATIDVLHHLIERVAGFGVTTLEDLVAMTSARIDRTFAKIRLADDVPRAGGVYRFIGVGGETLYVGKAADLRARVRSYFYGDPRRKVRDLLRQVDRIEVETYPTMLEAEVAEARAIARELPPHNRAGKRHASWYLKLHTDAKVPKLASSRVPKEDGSLYLGPFAGVRVVKMLIAGLQDAYRIHRCSEPALCRGCAFSEMRVCAGSDRKLHAAELERLARSLATDAEEVFVALEAKMRRMSAARRYEEATDAREQGAVLERALRTEVLVRSLVDAGEVVLRIGDRFVLLRDGQLAAAADAIPAEPGRQIDALRAAASSEPVGAYVPSAVQREARVIARWLTRNAASCELVSVTGRWVLPLHAGRLGDRFRPRAESAG